MKVLPKIKLRDKLCNFVVNYKQNKVSQFPNCKPHSITSSVSQWVWFKKIDGEKENWWNKIDCRK